MNYQIEYNDTSCSNAVAPDPVVAKVKRGSTVLQVMEEVVDTFGSAYQFSATYFGGEFGYVIDSINGTATDVANSCIWSVFFLNSMGVDVVSTASVSDIRLFKSGITVIWRYLQTQVAGTTTPAVTTATTAPAVTTAPTTAPAGTTAPVGTATIV